MTYDLNTNSLSALPITKHDQAYEIKINMKNQNKRETLLMTYIWVVDTVPDILAPLRVC
jgi:hypothetical protein